MPILSDLSYMIPELMLAVGAMALLIAGVFMGDKSARLISTASIALLIATLLVVAAMSGWPERDVFGGAFRIDAFSTFVKLLILAAAALAILMSDKYLAGEQLGRFEYPVLIVLAATGMLLMASANDLISLYMGVETQSLALYILAAFHRDSRRSTEAGLKYFVLGALSSCLLLYGASLVYGFTGATQFDAIASVSAEAGKNVGFVIGLVFLISGLAFKVSAAPFHMWTPDVYEGAPTPVTAFFAAAPKLAAMALFARAMIAPFAGVADQWTPIIAILAVASMAVGAFSAIVQTNIKRLMAYSSIGHMGFALIGLAAGTAQGVRATLIYMAIYVVMTIGTFACILLMRRRGGMTETVDDLAGLSKTNPGLSLIMTVLFFSLAGVPPMAGFFGKFFVFQAAIEAEMIWVAVAGAVLSVVAAYYYLRVIWIMWFNEPAPVFEREQGSRLGVTAFVSALLILPVLPALMGPLASAAERAAAALF
ncbi:MAG TPA: NADH-quinone oxidoreductase subunit NuoN [Parvularcula sp.]|nr:NADH-quinone oxidoreductase subunit NuoN [Parvularcula sp.]HBS32402.1 NADH-quinone oxidoreductase subunit NuoN [Parvularcula sp.]HBS33928.1 NADH-quinone oxidoreductase subunit NuoN [Parvularcula sp.]